MLSPHFLLSKFSLLRNGCQKFDRLRPVFATFNSDQFWSSDHHEARNFTSIQSKRFLANQTTTSIEKQQSDAEDDILYKRLQIEARSADRGVLDSYEKFVLMAAKFLDIPVSRSWEPFRSIKRRTLLRSAFVKKKYRVQYEFRTYFRNIEFKYLTGSTADTFLEYIERNLPEGTALKVTKQRIEKVPEHLKPPPTTSPSDGQNETVEKIL